MRLTKWLLFLCALVLINACKNDKASSTPTKSETSNLVIPSFKADSAYQFIVDQVEMGPRVPGTDAHKAFIDWSANKLRGYGAEVILQDFETDTPYQKSVKGTNIIAQFNPVYKKRLVLAAHFDSRYHADQDDNEVEKKKPVDGADDGASGVGVLMEIARILSSNEIKMGIDIVFFDVEDQGDSNGAVDSWGIGAQYWSKNLFKPGYRPKFGILLDMVGAKNAQFAKETYSMRYAETYVNKIWSLARGMSYTDLFINETSGAIDDHYFVNTIAGIPMLDIINKAPGDGGKFGAHWHTQDDNIDIISKRTILVVGRVVTAAIFKESVGEL